MGKQVVIIGASGHGKVIADIVLRCGDQVVGFLDDNPNAPSALFGFPLLGKTADYVRFPDAHFVIAIGNAAVRKRLAQTMKGVIWYTAIHPKAVVSALGVTVGEGSVIAAGAVVNPGATVGKHCIINTNAVVEHDCTLGDYVHISVAAALGGTVAVGDSTWVGIGSAVRNNLSICSGATVGAGAVVVKNIEEPGTYVGVPARKML